jgi:catechol 2,3-dioxygenase-like lactoylglutathione lyase family enzyme
MEKPLKSVRIKSILPFIGSDDYNTSRTFYKKLGFEEVWYSPSMSRFDWDGFGFYLQDAHVQDWVENTMLFLEVEDLEGTLEHIISLDIVARFPKSRLSKIIRNDWGDEFFLHDPSGILWHIGSFNT